MSIPILQSCRKRKCRPKLFGFHTFGDPGCPIDPSGAFRDNVHLFLRECAVLEDYTLDGMPIWCTLLMHEKKSFVIPMYTVQENVQISCRSLCDHCRCAGWGKHYVSKRSYHIIIPIDSAWNKPLDDGALELSNHHLHGLIHANGFGHLICINGIEGGSRYLCGREIMDLWDRICTVLRTRKITVEDSSKKRSMDLRLLYGVAYGHTWFGRWGYRFLRGNFGVTEQNYHKAIDSLSSRELEKAIRDFRSRNRSKEIKTIIDHYRNMSETNLITLRDLLRFMLTVKKSSAPQKHNHCTWKTLSRGIVKEKVKTIRYKKFAAAIAEMDRRWPARRLQQAAEVIVNALLDKKKQSRFGHAGMTRQDVRDAARLHIGDTGLLDNVLKSLNNVIVGNYVIHRSVNPITRILEYTVHELGGGTDIQSTAPEAGNSDDGKDVYDDLVYMYTNILLNYPDPDSGRARMGAQAILDSKHFMKEWPFRDEDEQVLTFICRIFPTNVEDCARIARLPGEIVVLPVHATIMDLKMAAETAFRDTYCAFEQVAVKKIEGMEGMDDGEVLFGVIESGTEVWMAGDEIDAEESQYKCEAGAEDNWKVRCVCGAEDDDGERMVSCDICEVWQHTRCCGIEDSESVPPLFVCTRCCGEAIQTSVKEEVLEYEYEYENEHSHSSGEFDKYGCLLLPPEMECQYGNAMELEY